MEWGPTGTNEIIYPYVGTSSTGPTGPTGPTSVCPPGPSGVSGITGPNCIMFYPWPNSPSIPPASFYTPQGLAGFLNQNPSYNDYFVGYKSVSPYLISTTAYLSSKSYKPADVTISPVVTTLSYQQAQLYRQQLELFQRVYAFNSNAYVTFLKTYNNPQGPVYYRFQTYTEYMNYKSSVTLVNKMYPFDAMAFGTTSAGSTLGWTVPFPL